MPAPRQPAPEQPATQHSAALQKLRDDARQIWQAGVDAVTPERLFRDKVALEGTQLLIEDVQIDLRSVRRLVIVGAGKAAAAMSVALQQTVLDRWPKGLPAPQVAGWINAPAGTFSAADARRVAPVHLHPARPAGANIPTMAAVQGTQQILQLVSQCDARDVVVCLLSGGGSALLVAPRPGVTLEDKQAIALEMAAAGANIQQLNAVRRGLSQVKGGGLARACRAGRLISLILSDVLGDPLETIASGPTYSVPNNDPAKNDAAKNDASRGLDALRELRLLDAPGLANAIRCLQGQVAGRSQATLYRLPTQATATIEHVILGNNADAVDAAGVRSVELGYRYVMQAATTMEGDVLQVARSAVDALGLLTSQDQIDCWISGGEPTVTLPKRGAGKGGRNQQLALAVLYQLPQPSQAPSCDSSNAISHSDRCEWVFLSGGTDGEDGPTDAAGALIDSSVYPRLQQLELSAGDYLKRADAYTFFDRLGGLLRSGPTGTNVCDLRIALASWGV